MTGSAIQARRDPARPTPATGSQQTWSFSRFRGNNERLKGRLLRKSFSFDPRPTKRDMSQDFASQAWNFASRSSRLSAQNS